MDARTRAHTQKQNTHVRLVAHRYSSEHTKLGWLPSGNEEEGAVTEGPNDTPDLLLMKISALRMSSVMTLWSRRGVAYTTAYKHARRGAAPRGI